MSDLQGTAIASAEIATATGDLTDLKSVRRWLKRNLAPTSDTPYVYIEPLEAQFARPAVTIRLVTTRPAGTRQARRPTYAVEHQLVMTAYGRDRAETMTLADATWRLLMDGGHQGAPYRIPMWEFASGNRLARFLRVDPGSLSFSLETTDDAGLWSRTIEALVRSPRDRQRLDGAPLMTSVTMVQGP